MDKKRLTLKRLPHRNRGNVPKINRLNVFKPNLFEKEVSILVNMGHTKNNLFYCIENIELSNEKSFC
jgi:hypothetical protein